MSVTLTSPAPGAADDPADDRARRFAAVSRAFEWPVALLALLVVPALVVEDTATSAEVRLAARTINWVVWLGFCVEYATKLVVAPVRSRYARAAWFDLLLILVSPPFLVPEPLEAVRSLRALRILRLLRATAVAGIGLRLLHDLLRHRRFHYVLAVAVATIAMGALGVFVVERGENPAIASIGDAIWWAIVTATTVGYGDVSPVSSEGRLIAVALMLMGIGVIGVFTATVASFFLRSDEETAEPEPLAERLARVEAKLDELIALSKALRTPGTSLSRSGRAHGTRVVRNPGP